MRSTIGAARLCRQLAGIVTTRGRNGVHRVARNAVRDIGNGAERGRARATRSCGASVDEERVRAGRGEGWCRSETTGLVEGPGERERAESPW